MKVSIVARASRQPVEGTIKRPDHRTAGREDNDRFRMNDPIQVVVAHKGAREHFLAARALQRQGMLAKLVTDWYAPISPAWANRLRLLGRGVARALGAQSPELPRARVRSLSLFGLRSRWAMRRAEAAGRLLEAMADDDQAFARAVARLPLPNHQAFLGYSYAALEALQAERQRGCFTVVDQIDPGRLEWDLVREETARWPIYADPMGEAPAGYYERAVAEWQAAHVIVVNSEWSRSALVRQGADPARIEVIPLAYEASTAQPDRRARPDRVLTVLWLGSVILRKGIAHLVEAARLLAGEQVRFVVAGPIGIHAEAMRQAPANVQWLGPVARSEARRLYETADLFVLPTLSDGFAITQVEALAHGVPVIATPNCGAVVEEGRTGFLIPAGDAAPLAKAVQRFIRDPALAGSMRKACLESAARYSVDAFGQRLGDILRKGLATMTPHRASLSAKMSAP